MAVIFAYRSHYEGVLSKRIVRFDDSSVLAWFQRMWPLAIKAKDAHAFIAKQLGGKVYGFAALFEAAKKKALPVPTSLKKLESALREHLYVEGGIRLDAHTLRVHTDDDEVELAYFFFDEAAQEPERVAYLLLERFPLPTKAKTGKFVCPVEIAPLAARGSGGGRTYLVFLTFYDSESLPSGPVSVIEGVEVPELLAFLRSEAPPSGKPKDRFPPTWPLELRLLRACIEPEDPTLGPAAARAAAYPLHAIGGGHCGRAGLGPQRRAFASFEQLAAESSVAIDAEKSHVDVSEHMVQIATHQSEYFGHQQWFIFDDAWAAANRDLAASLLRYAAGWDPWTDDDDE